MDTAPSPRTRSWTLTPDEYDATLSKVQSINNRARKRGFTGTVDITGTPKMVEDPKNPALMKKVFETEIVGESPSYAGWSFLASATSVDGGFVLGLAPGVDDASIDRSKLEPGYCAHCQVRNNRKRTFVVKNDDTGETVQVGSTCLKDFAGWDTHPVFVTVDKVIEDIESALSKPGLDSNAYGPVEVVAVAIAIVNAFGFTPASFAHSTRSAVDTYLHGDSGEDISSLAVDTKRAKTVVNRLINELADDNYGNNLRALLESDSVPRSQYGLLASAPTALRKIDEKHEKAKEATATEYYGTIGERVTVTGVVDKIVELENNYGYHPSYSNLIILKFDNVVVKMTTAAQWSFDIENGDTVTVIGTVKGHSVYGAEKQTVLNRPRRKA